MDSTFLLLDLPVSDAKGLDRDSVLYSFKKVEHAKVLSKNLALMQGNEGLLTDVVLRSTSKDYEEPFHSIMLAACSPIIKRKLTGKHFDCTGGTLSLKELTTDVLISFRNFLYKAEFPSGEESVDSLQKLAVANGIDSLEKLSDQYKKNRHRDEEMLVLLNSQREELLSQLHEMYKKSELATTLLEDAKGVTQLAVHAPVVAAASPVLREILSNDLLSPEETKYRLKEVAPNVLKDLVEYIYTGDVTLNGENVVGLLNVAHSYEIPALSRACCDWLSLKLESYNAVNIMLLARNANSNETKVLKEDAKSFIIANFASVCEEAEFAELDYEDLKEIIQHDNLCVNCEEDVFHAVAKWVDADEDGRSLVMPELLRCIRLENTSVEFLLNLQQDPHIMKSTACVEIVKSVLERLASFHVAQENPFTTPTTFDEYEKALFPGREDNEEAIARNLLEEFSKSESELPGSEGLVKKTPKRVQRKSATPDMRLKENRRLLGMQNKDNSPDMRFKVNKEGLNLPLKRDGAADMRSKVHRQSLGKDGEGRPLKKDGTPDRRFKVTRDKEAGTVRSSYQNGSTSVNGPVKKDGTPDMRYAVNKQANSVLTTSQTSNPMERSSHAGGPVKKDGTLDMRFAVNKQSASISPVSSYRGSSSQLSSCSSASGPVKRDGTPDMRYAVNKSSYGSSPASCGYSSGGSSYSSRSSSSGSVSGLSSRGPLKSDGTPDMRYAVNRSSYGSYSSGGSSYSSRSSSSGGAFRSSSCGPLKSNGTPDMRFKANRR